MYRLRISTAPVGHCSHIGPYLLGYLLVVASSSVLPSQCGPFWVYFSLSCWDWNGAIPGFWKAEVEMWWAKRHVTITHCENKSRDQCASESKKWWAKSHKIITHCECISRGCHVIIMHWKGTWHVGVRIRASRVPDRYISSTLLWKKGRKIG